jgi:competence protein CoiA
MTDAERLSRELFYGNLVWVIDGSVFRENFDILHMLPDPTSEIARDLVWFKAGRSTQGAARGLFWRVSENPETTKRKMVEIHSLQELGEQINQSYRGHHQYDWVRPRRTWLDAKSPVYIDFGSDLLVKLDTYAEYDLPCIRYISKRKFVHDVMIEKSAQDIATRFYPLQ